MFSCQRGHKLLRWAPPRQPQGRSGPLRVTDPLCLGDDGDRRQKGTPERNITDIDVRKKDSFIVIWHDGDWSLLERSPATSTGSAGSNSLPRWSSSTNMGPCTLSRTRATPRPARHYRQTGTQETSPKGVGQLAVGTHGTESRSMSTTQTAPSSGKDVPWPKDCSPGDTTQTPHAGTQHEATALMQTPGRPGHLQHRTYTSTHQRRQAGQQQQTQARTDSRDPHPTKQTQHHQ